jgi:hypothetical protein
VFPGYFFPRLPERDLREELLFFLPPAALFLPDRLLFDFFMIKFLIK